MLTLADTCYNVCEPLKMQEPEKKAFTYACVRMHVASTESIQSKNGQCNEVAP